MRALRRTLLGMTVGSAFVLARVPETGIHGCQSCSSAASSASRLDLDAPPACITGRATSRPGPETTRSS